jgi:hypothetical protein
MGVFGISPIASDVGVLTFRFGQAETRNKDIRKDDAIRPGNNCEGNCSNFGALIPSLVTRF